MYRELALTFRTARAVAKSFELYQNTPNPFTQETLISFYLPTASQAPLLITNAAGRLVYQVKGDFSAGFNTVNLNRTMLNGITGVLNYTLLVGGYQASCQMIVVE
jgi:hypothetical protein